MVGGLVEPILYIEVIREEKLCELFMEKVKIIIPSLEFYWKLDTYFWDWGGSDFYNKPKSMVGLLPNDSLFTIASCHSIELETHYQVINKFWCREFLEYIHQEEGNFN